VFRTYGPCSKITRLYVHFRVCTYLSLTVSETVLLTGTPRDCKNQDVVLRSSQSKRKVNSKVTWYLLVHQTSYINVTVNNRLIDHHYTGCCQHTAHAVASQGYNSNANYTKRPAATKMEVGQVIRRSVRHQDGEESSAVVMSTSPSLQPSSTDPMNNNTMMRQVRIACLDEALQRLSDCESYHRIVSHHHRCWCRPPIHSNDPTK
jgi:hypothetical protein